MAVADLAFIHNPLVHFTTEGIPLHTCSDTFSPLPTLNVFGQRVHIPNFSITSKLLNLSKLARYVSPDITKPIMLQLQNCTITKVRIGYFHPIVHNKDPIKTHIHAFASLKQIITDSSTVITPGTLPPVNLTHALKYPDAANCKISTTSHYKNLKKRK